MTGQTATLYKLTKERSTIGDDARSSAIECYLNMCQFHYKLVECNNADYMSPSRTSPFLVIPVDQGSLILSSFEAISNYIETQGVGVAAGMDNIDKADTMATSSLVNNLVIAEQYFTWVHYDTYKKDTRPAVGGDKPWPLNHIIPVMDRVKFVWNNYTLYRMDESQVISSCRQSLSNLSVLLEDGAHSFSTSGRCPVDALVYGHVQTIRNCGICELAGMVKNYPNLLEYCDFVTQEHFNIGIVVNEQ
ncbi:metaxin-2-like isoform X2 [Dysidea avara]